MHHIDSFENLKEEVSGYALREVTSCKCNPVKEIAAIHRLHCYVSYRPLSISFNLKGFWLEVCVFDDVIVFANLLNNFMFLYSQLNSFFSLTSEIKDFEDVEITILSVGKSCFCSSSLSKLLAYRVLTDSTCCLIRTKRIHVALLSLFLAELVHLASFLFC